MAENQMNGIGIPVLQPTAGSNISIINGGYAQIGQFVLLNIKLKTTAAIAQHDILLSGMPRSGSNAYFNIGSVYNANAYGCRSGNDKLYANTTIPNATELCIQGVYFT